MYNRLFTLHGVVMVFLFIIPSIPAALGTSSCRCSSARRTSPSRGSTSSSLYIYAFGACFALYSLVHGGVDTGWTFYTPYSTRTTSYVIPMILGRSSWGSRRSSRGELHRDRPQDARARA
jgi:cytochrome c oxidase subunit 1